MEPMHYEKNRALMIKTFGLDLEQEWARLVTPHMGDRLLGLVDTMRHEPLTRLILAGMASGNVPHKPGDEMLVISDFQSMHNFWKGGKRVFVVSEALAEMLKETELKTAKFFLHLPYPAMFIRFEKPPMEIWCGNWLPLDGIYVYEMEDDLIGTQGVRFTDVLRDPEFKIESRGRERRIKIVAVSKNELPNEQYRANMVFSSSRWNQPDDCIVDEAFIQSTWDLDRIEATKKVFPKETIDQCMPLWRLALNVIAYVNSVGSDVERKAAPVEQVQERLAREQGCQRPPKRLFKQAQGESRLSYYAVGGRIMLPPHRGTGEHRETGQCRVLHYRHCVRGHFRQYHKLKVNLTPDEMKAIRADEGDRVKISKWLQPFWRGPDTAEVINREYRVEKRDEH